MIIQYYTLMISKAVKQRLFLVAASLDSVAIRKGFTTRVSPKVFDSTQFFNSIFETSLKSYVDTSKIHFLEKYFSPISSARSTYNFVTNEAIAKDIVEKILSRIDVNKSIIVEGNPGIGLITLNLICSGVTNLYVCDSTPLKHLSLKQILEKHPDKIKLENKNINYSLDSVIMPVYDIAQEQNKTVILIAVTSSYYLLRSLTVEFLKYSLWKTSSEIYLVITTKIWNSLRNFSPSVLKYFYYCAFNLLFTIEPLESYPCKEFLPVTKTNEDFNLLKISINPNIFENIKMEELMDYIIFITILGAKSDNVIIPTLEKWLPNCGPYLISKGISMTNKISDISHQESIILYNYFKNCEGYNDFKVCVSNAFNN